MCGVLLYSNNRNPIRKTKMTTKDRHRPGYWKERWQKQKKNGVKQKDRHRPGYYREYNLKHPERLARIGVYVNPDGTITDTRNQSNTKVVNMSALEYHLWVKEHQWHDDDWEED